ncbi:AraC family transcriptional regulator [Dactylosporangium sp. McL0621]|uniref:AraC family transcriptional regulator n=1 Tax=Dactylosporangium sp. McL0621 TaxID=3415678 RepID=UPI003CEEEE9C
MDVLADVLTAMRVGRPRSVYTELRAPWGLRFTGVAGAGFHIVLQGRGWLLFPDHAPLALAAGDVVFTRHRDGVALADDLDTPLVDTRPVELAAGEATGRFRLDGDGARTVLLCGAYVPDRHRPHPLLDALPEVLHLPARLGGHPAVTLLHDETTGAGPGAVAVVPALIDALLVYILRTWFAQQPETGWGAALGDPSIAAALRGIHAEPARAWTVAALAAAAGMSRAAFARRFTALIGQAPLTYVTQWRMILGARLLRETDAPLRTVAGRVGYDSPYAFAVAFKRWHGQPPGRYRLATR